jgi:hypothetical protein
MPQIDCYVEDLTPSYPDELGLWMRQLIVQATKRAPHGRRVIVLHESAINVELPVPQFMKCFHKKASIVLRDSRLDQN